MNTAIDLALIAYETEAADWGYPEDGPSGADYYPRTARRPAGVRLDNDGVMQYWLPSTSRRYQLAHDGVGWRVTEKHLSGHVWRLADAAAAKDTFIDWLPLEDGSRLTLDPSRTYELKFDYIEDLSHPPQRGRTALTLREA